MLWDDVLAAGAVGLIKAADRYRSGIGRFSGYCRKFVRREIRRELQLTRPLVTGLDLSFIPDHRTSHVPSLEPMFGVKSFVPSSPCPHPPPPVRLGPFVCAVCHATDWDRHPELQLTARDLNPRRRRRVAVVLPIPVLPETRKQRRLRLFPRPVAV